MAAQFISPFDLDGRMPVDWDIEKVQAEIDTALAWVRIHVRCMDNLDEHGVASVNAVLRKAIPFNAAQSPSGDGGSKNQVSAGPLSFSVDTTTRDSGGYFSPAQISALSGLCGSRRGSFGTIRTRPL